MSKKSFNTNNMVIVCEGTETEYPYFDFLANKVSSNFDCIKVVPSPEDKLNSENIRTRQNRRLRKLASENKDSEKKSPIYVTLQENETDIYVNYNKYKKAPAKYVREAYLWLTQGFSEAWAVYDLDDTDDPNHESHSCAKDLIDNNKSSLYKAFSSYSFEEWLLLHFERCITPFRNSAYTKKNVKNDDEKQKYDCNGKSCKHKNTCKAECIGNYLEKKGYYNRCIEKVDKCYEKHDGQLYAMAIYQDKKLRHRAYVNASWTRSLKKDVFYECNPYSDVDKLIMRLMGENYEILWVKLNEEFYLNNCCLKIELSFDNYFISLQDTNNIVINTDDIFWCDDDYEKVENAIEGINISFLNDRREPKLIKKSSKYKIFCIKNNNQEIYIDLS